MSLEEVSCVQCFNPSQFFCLVGSIGVEINFVCAIGIVTGSKGFNINDCLVSCQRRVGFHHNVYIRSNCFC